MRQSREELIEHLKDRVTFVRSSAAAFDQGLLAEAKRLSTEIRLLVHEGAGRSLLGLLGIKDQLMYVDTSFAIDPRNLLSTSGLAVLQLQAGGDGSFSAPLDDLSPPRQKPPVEFDFGGVQT